MKEHRRHYRQMAVRIVVLFLLLLLIGLVTRMPALAFPQLYALHGVLAAPFCSALAQWHFRHKGSVGELVVATGLLALMLGIKSLVMGVGFASVAAILLIVGSIAKARQSETSKLLVAVIFGASNYPCALVCGVLFGSYFPSAESAATIIIMFGLSCALSLLGTLILSFSPSRSASSDQPL